MTAAAAVKTSGFITKGPRPNILDNNFTEDDNVGSGGGGPLDKIKGKIENIRVQSKIR